jgi:arylsulfatase A-like enzyme
MTGKNLWTHQTYFVEVASKYIRENDENLPFLLKKDKYRNIAIQQVHKASVKKLGISNRFDIVIGPGKLSYSADQYAYIDKILYKAFGEKIILYDWIIREDFIFLKWLNKILKDSSVTDQQPEKAFNKFFEIINDNFSEPFFAWIHLFPPHDPYLPPKPFMGMFNSSSELRTWKSQSGSSKLIQIDILKDRYDEFIRYCDKQFKEFIKQVEERSELKNTVIILSADHGESFGHDFVGHGGPHLYEQITHIPLIIKTPNHAQGQIINDLVSQVDIPATILDLAGIMVPSWMEGGSLVPFMRGEKLSPKPAFSMSLVMNPGKWHKIEKGTIAVWEGEYKLIHYLKKNESLLFNLKEDPDELNNLFDKKPEVGQHLLNLILRNLQNANERILLAK